MAWPTPGCNKLIDAMVVAEGGQTAFLRAVRISIPNCKDYAEARGIAANTIAHALWDYYTASDVEYPNHFVMFLGSRWAPIGVKNDPHNLNKNWVPNVLKALGVKTGG